LFLFSLENKWKSLYSWKASYFLFTFHPNIFIFFIEKRDRSYNTQNTCSIIQAQLFPFDSLSLYFSLHPSPFLLKLCLFCFLPLSFSHTLFFLSLFFALFLSTSFLLSLSLSLSLCLSLSFFYLTFSPILSLSFFFTLTLLLYLFFVYILIRFFLNLSLTSSPFF